MISNDDETDVITGEELYDRLTALEAQVKALTLALQESFPQLPHFEPREGK